MSEFKSCDFVQVEHVVMLGKGEPTYIWRNALYKYKDADLDAHVVTYTDGQMEVLNKETRIRKAELIDKVQIREFK